MTASISPTLIFVFPYSITAWDAKRYGFEYLLQQNIHLIVLDLSPLVPSRSDAGKSFLTKDYIIKISSYSSLEQFVKRYSNSAIFIDCINGLAGLRWKTRHIFKIFKRHNIRYFIVEIGSLPLVTSNHNVPKLQRIFSKFKKALQVKKLMIFLLWKLGNIYADLSVKYRQSYQLPHKIFVGHTELLQPYLARYGLDESCVIPIHSFDYDRYLEHRAAELLAPHALPKKYCVFIDQGLAFHSDFGKAIGFCPITADHYFPAMCEFFDIVEKKLHLEVIIASNPRVNYSDKPNIFGKRKLIPNITMELVAHSQFVLAHNSTAVNFAVLYNKPLLLIETSEMRKAFGFSQLIHNMAYALGVQVACIDDQQSLAHLDLSNYQQWPKHYQPYLHRYIKSEGIPDKKTWEFVLDEIQH